MNAATKDVARAAAKVAAARTELEDAIYEARAQGLPLRPIAAAADLSPETVRQIIQRAGTN